MIRAALDALDALPRFSLLDGASPIQRLHRLEAALGGRGPRLYAKRDDIGPVGVGGNKLRKLELLIGAAIAEGCDTFITVGARQSNHARLSAAAAARAGLACELVLTDSVDRTDDAYARNGNVLLDALFGARVHRLPAGADAVERAQARADELAQAGRRAYVVGSGGSSPLGCLGYARCAAEIVEQEKTFGERFAQIIVPNGSSGTHAGLVAGLAALGDDPARALSFTVLAPVEQAHAATVALARAALGLIAPAVPLMPGEVRVDPTQRGPGYGIPTDAMVEAVTMLARSEGLVADPVYSGKALAGMIARARAAADADHAVLFVMTGGVPGLFAYEPVFRASD